MAFSIGRFLGGLAGTAAGILTGQPSIALAGVSSAIGAFNGGSSRGPTQPAPQRRALPALVSAAQPQFPRTALFGSGVAAPAARQQFGLPAVVSDASNVADILRRMRENTGAVVSSRKISDMVKHCGFAMTAESFGVSEIEVCMVVVHKRRRRSRGITAAALRTTRSTIRKVETIHKSLHKTATRARARKAH